MCKSTPLYYSNRNKVQAIPTVSNDGEGISHTLAKMLSDIYYGRVNHPWAVEIDRWDKQTTASSNTKSHEEDDQLVHYRKVLDKPGLYSG